MIAITERPKSLAEQLELSLGLVRPDGYLYLDGQEWFIPSDYVLAEVHAELEGVVTRFFRKEAI